MEVLWCTEVSREKMADIKNRMYERTADECDWYIIPEKGFERGFGSGVGDPKLQSAWQEERGAVRVAHLPYGVLENKKRRGELWYVGGMKAWRGMCWDTEESIRDVEWLQGCMKPRELIDEAVTQWTDQMLAGEGDIEKAQGRGL